MRKIHSILLTTVLVLSTFSMITYTSCQQDKCKDVNCQNGGGCAEGVCICPTGYTGTLCQNAPAPDPCANVVCQNGGTCNNGSCTCAAGFEGTNCETTSATKFIGSYNVTEQCSQSGSVGPYVAVITQSTTNAVTINLNNFGDYNGNLTVTGTISNSTTLTIPTQIVSGYTFSGSGVYNNGTITINYTATTQLNSETCTSIWVKQ